MSAMAGLTLENLLAPRVQSGIFRGLGAYHVLFVLAFVAATLALYVPGYGGLNADAVLKALQEQVRDLPMLLATGVTAVAATVAVDNAIRGRRTRFAGYVLAGLLAAAVGALVVHAMPAPHRAIQNADAWARIPDASRPYFVAAFTYLLALYHAAPIVVIYAILEANRRTARALQAARLAALAGQHALVEDELRTMQARVDPEVLFESLREIDASYARDLGAGQERLDALIRFLRAALPGDGATTSTVAREQEIVEAYAALAAPAAAVKVDADASLQDEPMPSMLLLPLARWALDGTAAQTFGIRLRRNANGSEIAIESRFENAAPPPDTAIAGVRERLARLFAQGAHLDVQSASGTRRAVLRLPAPAAGLQLRRAA